MEKATGHLSFDLRWETGREASFEEGFKRDKLQTSKSNLSSPSHTAQSKKASTISKNPWEKQTGEGHKENR